ncbi:hypothetical protein LOK49_LG12G00425 [Camellia lanceoleosa]|uniref:Uncharacterized protein n=1 Tax=Camellia lanceoleosa TaxID=1840588 RepID=A0ACC0FNE8_9ERIC|nr:hypothetical protein LOK49_LG12G00425 [Camellia lanceoleosa]
MSSLLSHPRSEKPAPAIKQTLVRLRQRFALHVELLKMMVLYVVGSDLLQATVGPCKIARGWSPVEQSKWTS